LAGLGKTRVAVVSNCGLLDLPGKFVRPFRGALPIKRRQKTPRKAGKETE